MNGRTLLLSLLWGALSLVSAGVVHALELTERDNGRTVAATQGETVTVSLEGNPSTGYSWELVNYNREILTPKGESGFIRDAERPGAGGRFVFRFEAKAAGDTRLQLVYIRPWEHKVRPAMAFEVVVSVPVGDGAPTPQIKYQPIFSRSKDTSLLRITREEPQPVWSQLGWSFAPLGSYAVGKRKGSEELLVSRGRQPALKISLPASSHRPLDARWLNAKLLYLEAWFNPHNGAYWILDVELERLVAHELMNDGMAP